MTKISKSIAIGMACAVLAAGISTDAEGAKRKSSRPASGPGALELLEQADAAYMVYDLDEASRLVSQARAKAGKNGEVRDRATDLSRRIANAQNYMDRVERLVVLDSINAPRADVLKLLQLPASAGRLTDGKPAGIDTRYLFTNENGDFRAWAMPDSLGNMTIAESVRLTDGKWQEPYLLPELGKDGNDAAYPFMMSDGLTMYYALDDPEGMGGYDLMVATRESADGDFLQPQNLGMPYNSPYDDYLLAIDELNGVGWLVTDRNQLGDDVTIYLYKVNDMRRNYDPDETEDLSDRAMLYDWKATQEPDADYSELLATVHAIDPEATARKVEFILPMDDEVVYTQYDDFKSHKAASMMQTYMKEKQDYEQLCSTIDDLRHKFHKNHDTASRNMLVKLEAEQERSRTALKKRLSEVYQAERGL